MPLYQPQETEERKMGAQDDGRKQQAGTVSPELHVRLWASVLIVVQLFAKHPLCEQGEHCCCDMELI